MDVSRTAKVMIGLHGRFNSVAPVALPDATAIILCVKKYFIQTTEPTGIWIPRIQWLCFRLGGLVAGCVFCRDGPREVFIGPVYVHDPPSIIVVHQLETIDAAEERLLFGAPSGLVRGKRVRDVTVPLSYPIYFHFKERFAGEEAIVEAPGGAMEYEITAVRYE